MKLKKFNEFVNNNTEESYIDAKMQELKDLIEDSTEGQNIIYEWENKDDHELNISFSTGDLSIKYDFDIDNMYLIKTAGEQVDFEMEVESIDEAIDIIEKDIHSILGIGESVKKSKYLKLFDSFEEEKDEDSEMDDFYRNLPDYEEDKEDDESCEFCGTEECGCDHGSDQDENDNIDLSIELERRTRDIESGEYENASMTIDDFLTEFGVDPKYMTGFGWAAILKHAQKYVDMSDEEFDRVYNEYKSKLNSK